MNKQRSLLLAAAAAAICGISSSAQALVSEEGYDINDLIGANTFYLNGFTGSGAIVAEVDAGLAWNGHQTLHNVSIHIPNPTAANQFAAHATAVGFTIAGSGVNAYQQGISYGATLWTGGVATEYFGDAFNDTPASFTTPYYNALIKGIGGKTANIVTSSFGLLDGTLTIEPPPAALPKPPPYELEPPATPQGAPFAPWYLYNLASASYTIMPKTLLLTPGPQTPPSYAGYYGYYSVNSTNSGNNNSDQTIDALIYESSAPTSSGQATKPAALFTAAAGNSGYIYIINSNRETIQIPTQNSIGAPASGNNAFVVGATIPTANGAVTNFSSIGPTSFFLPGNAAGTVGSGSYGLKEQIYIGGANPGSVDTGGINPGSSGYSAYGSPTVVNYNFSRARVDIVAPGGYISDVTGVLNGAGVVLNGLELAYYGGATGGNILGGAITNANNLYDFEDGTSFATPTVGASAALLVDAGKVRFASDSNAIDGRVLEAVLMNSATPIMSSSMDMNNQTEWNNGESAYWYESVQAIEVTVTTSGNTTSVATMTEATTVYPGGYVPLEGDITGEPAYVVTTSQALDYSQGAGELNMTNAYSQYLNGTHDVAEPTPVTLTSSNNGTGARGETPIVLSNDPTNISYDIYNFGGTQAPKPVNVQAQGWTFGSISANTSGSVSSLVLNGAAITNERTIHESYLINTILPANSELSATLVWDATAGLNTTTYASTYGTLDNLDLSLYYYPTMTLKAQSIALFGTAQELRVTVGGGYYMLDVSETLPIYNFSYTSSFVTDYALAWSDTTAVGIGTATTGANGFPVDSAYQTLTDKQVLNKLSELSNTTVPEPGSASLLGLGAVGLMLRRKKCDSG